MDHNLADLDAHEQPSDELRAEWKYFSRLEQDLLLRDARICDPRLPASQSGLQAATSIPVQQVSDAFSMLRQDYIALAKSEVPVLFHPLLPGLLIVPSLIPPEIQVTLVDRMIHRDLSNPLHQTNLHLHYDWPYPQGQTQDEKSFFSLQPEATASFKPKDPAIHKSLSAKQVMERRLHWVTLGGQYDWTNRVYPGEKPPEFPEDLASFLHSLFPDTIAQAAIVNFYSPGDTMMMHRDVSEETNKGLISLSFGCDGLFMISPSKGPDAQTSNASQGENGKEYLLLRLRSGDAIYMTNESRYAWHGVPRVLKGTCPSHLEDWPADGDHFTQWGGWMAGKRINLNVRQMRDEAILSP